MPVNVRGDKEHADHLKRMQADIELVGKAVFVGADLIRAEAQKSIVQGAVQGKGHVPSSPGQPPNRDTGQLDTGIITARTGLFTAEVASTAPYAAFLEYGTSKMVERPYMRPAALKKKREVMDLITRALKRIAK